jgi:hypothetical protein
MNWQSRNSRPNVRHIEAILTSWVRACLLLRRSSKKPKQSFWNTGEQTLAWRTSSKNQKNRPNERSVCPERPPVAIQAAESKCAATVNEQKAECERQTRSTLSNKCICRSGIASETRRCGFSGMPWQSFQPLNSLSDLLIGSQERFRPTHSHTIVHGPPDWLGRTITVPIGGFDFAFRFGSDVGPSA